MEGTFRTILDDIRDEGRAEGRAEARAEERQRAELDKLEILKQVEAAKKEAEAVKQEIESVKQETEAVKQEAKAVKEEAEAAKETLKLEEQRKIVSIRNLKQRKLSNEEIASILSLPLEKVKQVS